MEYPKIDTLFERDPKTFRVDLARLKHPEYGYIKEWHITEKIDGTNVRVRLESDSGIRYLGRTDNASLHPLLMEHLTKSYPTELVKEAFPTSSVVVLFMEGYGPKIQSGGSYRKDITTRLFDVVILEVTRYYWLEWEELVDIAGKLHMQTVPSLGLHTLEKSLDLLTSLSTVANHEGGQALMVQEGIVARTPRTLYLSPGSRLMWKLKNKDLPFKVANEVL